MPQHHWSCLAGPVKFHVRRDCYSLLCDGAYTMPATLPNGLYKIGFETRTSAEYGVAYLHDGCLRGDSGMAYLGTYKQDG